MTAPTDIPGSATLLAFEGLDAAAARARLAAEGWNELPSAQPRGLGAVALGIAREPMFLLLVGCGAVYLLLGDVHEALMLLAFVFIVMGITAIQELRTERALEALRDLSSPRALVVREGEERRIPGREVVRGDLIVIAEGDRVPADAVVLAGLNLQVDESLLTGEAVPVRKHARAPVPETMLAPGGDDSPCLYSGTLVVQGRGYARVLATGAQTALGRIGQALAGVEAGTTAVQREIRGVVTRVAWGAFGLSVLVALVYAATRGAWLEGLLVGLTMAMSILPEELPVILTIFLGLGAWRIAQQRVLTRRVPALETLGAATVLCTDKTGTLTHNRLELARLAADGATIDPARLPDGELPECFHALLEFGVLASQTDPFDPLEKAIRRCALETLARTEHLHVDWQLVSEYPLSPELLAVSRVWRSTAGAHYVIAAKGAPEAIADLCHLDAERSAVLREEVERLAGEGLRVIGVARAVLGDGALPPIQHDFDFELLGLLALADPLRESVPGAIREARQAGIRVVMITGDHPATASNVASRLDLDTSAGFLTGRDLETLSDAGLAARVQEVNVFCRVAPEQKLRLVTALEATGEVVAMTGDGVNDAPALKAAHIGIAMGGRGTDVAREAAALVLLDDDFASIVAAIRVGRRIFANLRKAIVFVLAAHIPIVGLTLLPVLLGWSLVLMPVHVLFLQLIIDPACSIAFEAEPEEADVMRRPPRASDARLFDRATLALAFVQGFIALAVVLVVHAGALGQGLSAEEARAMTFVTLVLAGLGLIVANRSRVGGVRALLAGGNAALWWIAGGTLLFLGLVLVVPVLREAFAFGIVHGRDLLPCLAGAAAGWAGFVIAARSLSAVGGPARH